MPNPSHLPPTKFDQLDEATKEKQHMQRNFLFTLLFEKSSCLSGNLCLKKKNNMAPPHLDVSKPICLPSSKQ